MKEICYDFGYIGKPLNSKRHFAVVQCPFCGQIYEIKWMSEKTKSLPQKAKNKIKVCKTCAKDLTNLKRTDFAVEQYSENCSSNSVLTEAFLQKKEQAFQDNIKKEIDKSCEKAKKFTELSPESKQCIAIKSSYSNLSEYLRHLVEIENGIYYLTENIFMLAQTEKDSLEQLYVDLFKSSKKETKKYEEQISQLENEFKQRNLEEELKAEGITKPTAPKYLPITNPIEPVIPTYKTPGLFNKKKILEENAALEAQYLRSMDEYRKKVEKDLENEKINNQLKKSYNSKLKTYNSKLKALKNDAQKELEEKKNILLKTDMHTDLESQILSDVQSFMKKEHSTALKELKKMVEARNQLYSYNVIHPNYRNLVAVHTIYEYIDTRRCSVLEGHEGAYNLYEAELQNNLINTKLDSIINSLEEIRENQLMLYKEIKQINSNLKEIQETLSRATKELQAIHENTSGMQGQLDNIIENTAIAAYNSAATAHYTKLNCELTNALGYMVAFK